jgi:VIT1/CCC1 family predicted Fe2+/Mn2+ transporter
MDKQANVHVPVPKHIEHHLSEGKYLKSIVYGGLDGIITTFAVVAGVAGASLNAAVVLILGFANLIGDGISMAVGDYLSTRAEQAYYKDERKKEEWEMDNIPKEEEKEVREIFSKKGFSKKDASSLTIIYKKNKKAMVDLMMVEELGLFDSKQSAIKNGIATFTSFVIFGFIPLLAYVLSVSFGFFSKNTFFIATVLTAITLFSLGALKTRITNQNWLKSGSEMLLVGGIAALAAYGIGYFVSTLV